MPASANFMSLSKLASNWSIRFDLDQHTFWVFDHVGGEFAEENLETLRVLASDRDGRLEFAGPAILNPPQALRAA